MQESLTNALKHGSGSADLSIDYQQGAVVVEVCNPVPAEAPSSSTGGHGLLGMRERVASLDGCFSATRGAGSFTVRVEIPRGAAA